MEYVVDGFFGYCGECGSVQELLTEIQTIGERRVPDDPKKYELTEHHRPTDIKQKCPGSHTKPIGLVSAENVKR